VGKIEKLLLKHPREAFVGPDKLQKQWKELNYSACPDFEKSVREYEFFVSLLERTIPEIHYLPGDAGTGIDSVYIRDAVLITGEGAILCSMGKAGRRGEPSPAGDYLSGQGIPILGRITGEGLLEGGDVVLFDEKTLAVGYSYRTNGEGIRQLKELTGDFIDEFVVVPMPHWDGPDDVLHLMSFISPVDHDLAVVYSRLMPILFREWLVARGTKLIEVPETEFPTMACNILTVAPRKCVMIEGNPLTKNLLEAEGVEVMEYAGEEISKKGAGGPTCLTRPLTRVE
jgi:N-dimethylarginine dimethylaminohydrolase